MPRTSAMSRPRSLPPLALVLAIGTACERALAASTAYSSLSLAAGADVDLGYSSCKFGARSSFNVVCVVRHLASASVRGCVACGLVPAMFWVLVFRFSHFVKVNEGNEEFFKKWCIYNN